MTQQIVQEYPPNFDALDAAFNLRGRTDVVYSFGDTVFNPHGIALAPEILAHEAVHGRQQGRTFASIMDWWDRYIADVKFRLEQEAAAHLAEYRWLMDHAPRRKRRSALHLVAGKLAAPLYGPMVTTARARQLLTWGSLQ